MDQARWFLSRVGSDSARVSIEQMPFMVGRDAGCHLQLQSQRASRMHAQLSPSTVPNCLFLQDHESANGTYVNGVRFVEPVPVGHGDLIRFADEDWTLEVVDSPSATPTVRNLNLSEVADNLSD
ncbi:MAG: FHA domain-containing protein [Pseudomonadota bacterium]